MGPKCKNMKLMTPINRGKNPILIGEAVSVEMYTAHHNYIDAKSVSLITGDASSQALVQPPNTKGRYVLIL